MTASRSITSRQIVVGKLSYGCDLLEELTDECIKHNVKLGRVEAIGAVQKARIGFYNQETRAYQFSTLDRPFEITNLIGNVSLKDGNPFVHAHVTLAGETGESCGGHLAPGTVVFACEFFIEAFDGPIFNRNPDEETGLPLWSLRD